MRSVKTTIYPFNSSSSIEKQKNFRQEGRDEVFAVRLAQTATALLVIVCFLGLPIFWIQVMYRFSTIHLIHLQNQQLKQQNYLSGDSCRMKITLQENNRSENNNIFQPIFEEENEGRYECDPWAHTIQL
uniref:Uncharacterized protein n=1 Tax=Meloidogyne floridensis TaxID=298350 RepID=A0A915PFM0_9BILA